MLSSSDWFVQRGGLIQELTVKNQKDARTGDVVKIGLVRRIQYTGYVLAYIVSAAALFIGVAAGDFIGANIDMQALDVLL